MNILGWLGHNELILFKLKRYSSSTDKTARGEAQNDTQITTRAWLDIIYYGIMHVGSMHVYISFIALLIIVNVYVA